MNHTSSNQKLNVMRKSGLKVFGTAFLMLMTTALFAQGRMEHDGEKGDRFEKHLERMTEELELSDNQVKEIKAIHEKQQEKAEAVKNEKLTADERKDKMKVLHDEMRKEVEAVLSEEQKEKMKEQMKERHQHKKEKAE